MSMTNEEWCKLLDSVEAKWEFGTESTARGQIKDDEDRSYPEEGYVVVTEYKKPEPHDCEWCGDPTVSSKTYSRHHGDTKWTGKCQDKECKLRKVFLSPELNRLINKTHTIPHRKIV